MGILFVLFGYSIVFTLAAVLVAAAFGSSTYAELKNSPKRKRVTFAVVAFPFACIAFAGAWFLAYMLISEAVFHRDPSLGDTWATPLRNGYALMMIDTTDQGTVYDPRTQSGSGVVAQQDDAVFGVRLLQVSNKLIFGARDSKYFERSGTESKAVDNFFELDTVRKSRVEFKSLAELSECASRGGVPLKLRDFATVFGDYRPAWFDSAAFVILLLVPSVSLFAFARWVRRVKREAGILAA